MKTQSFFMALAICFGIASVVLGQTPQTKHLATGDDSYVKPTPQQEENYKRQAELDNAAAKDLHNSFYAQAESEARKAISLDRLDGVSEEVLAGALDAQGKDKEALQQYEIVVEHYDTQPRNLLPYAQLLLKSGQWAQAVALYNQVLPCLGHEELEQVSSHFTPDAPNPKALAVAIHLERGQLFNAAQDWAGEDQNTEATGEYAKALQLAPDYDLANYYYGFGWQKLSPAERAKFGNAQQAKVALQKAVKTGNADVKKAVERALKSAG